MATCKYCTKQNLHWKQLETGWRLFEDRALTIMHVRGVNCNPVGVVPPVIEILPAAGSDITARMEKELAKIEAGATQIAPLSTQLVRKRRSIILT